MTIGSQRQEPISLTYHPSRVMLREVDLAVEIVLILLRASWGLVLVPTT